MGVGVTSARANPGELRGIGLALLAMLIFGLMDAASKFLAARYPVAQIVWLRFVFTIPLALLVLPPRTALARLRSGRPGLQLVRSLILVIEIAAVVWCFGQMPLADVHSLLALTPLAVTALSGPFLGERVGPWRWAAVGVGFVGVLIILRPGLGVTHPAALMALLAVLLYSVYQILTRIVGRVDSAATTLLWQLLVGAAVLGLVVPFVWQTPEPRFWPLFVLVAALGGVGHWAMIRALQLAPAATIQPFTYTLLVWAVVIGWLGFGDLPDLWTLVGAGAVVGAGVFTALREHRLRSRA